MENILIDPYWTSRQKIITSEMNNMVDWFKGRLDSVEEKNSDFEARVLETIQNKIEKRIPKKKKISDLWDKFQSPNIHVFRVPERWGRTGKIFEEIMVKKFPDLMKSVILQIQEAQLTPAKDV